MAENKEKFAKETANYDDFKQDSKQGPEVEDPSKRDDSMPWFRCDYLTYLNRAAYVSSFFDHPFINPILYMDKFGELKDVDLYCLVGNNDCVLDGSIELARSWKGQNFVCKFCKTSHSQLSFFDLISLKVKFVWIRSIRSRTRICK